MSDYDDAVGAMTKVVTGTKYDVFKPPEVYATELVDGLVELGYAVKSWRDVPEPIREATTRVLTTYRDALEELACAETES